MMATTPLLQGQWRQLNKYASLTMAERKSWQGLQLLLQQRQRCLRINGKNTIAMRATMPSWWWRGCLRINDDKDTIGTRGTMLAWGQQGPHCNKGNNSIADQEQRHHSYEGDNASLTTASTPAHWQLQQCHCHEADNCNRDDGKDACTLTAMAPLQQGQWQATRATMLAQQNSGDACASMTATTPSWREQQMLLRQRQRRLRINSNNTITTRATTPAWQQATRATMLAW